MFNKAINEISISYLKDNSPVACIISFTNCSDISCLKEYKKTIMNFFQQNGFSFRILEVDDHFEIYVNYKTLMTVTDNTQSCSLINYLEELIPEEIKIGWGFGSGTYNCVVNAKIVRSNKFNSLAISKCLSMSLKGANRILNIIELRGYADIVYEKLDNSKGRPSKYYILTFLDKNGNLV